ncbi:Glycogen accumulation regulator GarA [Symmachiella macrocystis]|uniref:Glycogen accumulation regulator GarA n=1 Tax=Symmachiella macrocystis TaxID=2527985 RepID=A0A5C6BUE5_9PLAN|nr:FHA domain-containing protein [Symmachiella macrocystis]TWU14826.1 Glycogen accumulation regulator GarA [Symmachiella macrocystis]
MPICLTPHLDGDPIKLDKAILLVGRHPSCDIILVSSRKVSRIHCCIAQAGNRLLIRDLGSTNGVTVNGANVEESEIHLGDDVVIGDLKFFVGDGSENRAEGRDKLNGNGSSTPVKKMKGLDSVATPLVAESTSDQDYDIVEDSDVDVNSPAVDGEGSFAELSDSHVESL